MSTTQENEDRVAAALRDTLGFALPQIDLDAEHPLFDAQIDSGFVTDGQFAIELADGSVYVVEVSQLRRARR